MVLGGENVAGRPSNLSTEVGEGLDEDGGLDGHVEASGNAGTLKWLILSVLGTGGHKTWHFILYSSLVAEAQILTCDSRN